MVPAQPLLTKGVALPPHNAVQYLGTGEARESVKATTDPGMSPASFTLSLKQRRKGPGRPVGLGKQSPTHLTWAPLMRGAALQEGPGHGSKGGLLQPSPLLPPRTLQQSFAAMSGK